MHILLDESGTFGGAGTGNMAISTQGALVVPDSRLAKLEKKYAKLRASLDKNKAGEVKGNLLHELQIAEVVDLLRRNEVLFFASLIDLGSHSVDEIEAHRAQGVRKLAENLTDGHTPELRAAVADLQRRMQSFSLPLYSQMVVMTDLLHHMMGDMVNYHAQRQPKELAAFHWIVDGKEPGLVTDWEDWWKNTVIVWLQAKSLSKPGQMFEGGDFRFLEPFLLHRVPGYLVDKVPEPNAKGIGIDLQKMFWESFRFSSDAEPGLELVDIVTNALRRALKGNLKPEGWLPLRGLMLHKKAPYFRAVSIQTETRSHLVPKELAFVMNQFRTGGRSMLAPRYRTGT